jgi:hypothetical protein
VVAIVHSGTGTGGCLLHLQAFQRIRASPAHAGVDWFFCRGYFMQVSQSGAGAVFSAQRCRLSFPGPYCLCMGTSWAHMQLVATTVCMLAQLV